MNASCGVVRKARQGAGPGGDGPGGAESAQLRWAASLHTPGDQPVAASVRASCVRLSTCAAFGAGGVVSPPVPRTRRGETCGYAVGSTPDQSAMNSAIACAAVTIDGRCTRSSTPCMFSDTAPKHTAGVSP
jgi:hypothetical protein